MLLYCGDLIPCKFRYSFVTPSSLMSKFDTSRPQSMYRSLRDIRNSAPVVKMPVRSPANIIEQVFSFLPFGFIQRVIELMNKRYYFVGRSTVLFRDFFDS